MSIALGKVKAGHTSENLLNEISQSIYILCINQKNYIIYSLYQSKELYNELYYNELQYNEFNKVIKQNECYSY